MFFQHLTSDGLQASKKYSDPDFFKTYWVMMIKEQAEIEKARRKQEKDARRIKFDANKGRPVKEVVKIETRTERLKRQAKEKGAFLPNDESLRGNVTLADSGKSHTKKSYISTLCRLCCRYPSSKCEFTSNACCPTCSLQQSHEPVAQKSPIKRVNN